MAFGMPLRGLRVHLFLRSACATLCADVGAWEKAAALTGAEDDVVAVNGVLSASARFAVPWGTGMSLALDILGAVKQLR